MHTGVGRDATGGQLKVRGLFVGDDQEVFNQAAKLALEVNFQMLDEQIAKAVVYLDPSEFKSTWLGNKAIYRTRMAMADRGQLILLAPGLKAFGEDPEIARLIRKSGHPCSPKTLSAPKANAQLPNSLDAPAHLTHRYSDGRASITY